MNGLQYTDVVADRLPQAGYTVERDQLGADTVLGHRSDFRVRWMASTLHLFVHVGSSPVVTADHLEGFARASLEHAKTVKGGLRGFQSGVATIPVLAGAEVLPDAIELAERRLVRGFAAFAWPVVVDLSTGRRYSQTGRPQLGWVFNGWMREQIAAAVPVPAADPTLLPAPARG